MATSKQHPLSMTAWSVLGFMAGRKTQTRRIGGRDWKAGDLFYVSERIEWVHVDFMRAGRLRYLADDAEQDVEIPDRVQIPEPGIWRGRVLPHEWARERGVIVGVREERLQEISLDDVWAEGIDLDYNAQHIGWFNQAEHAQAGGLSTPGQHAETYPFVRLWDSINLARGHGWDANPLVRVLTLKRIDPADAGSV